MRERLERIENNHVVGKEQMEAKMLNFMKIFTRHVWRVKNNYSHVIGKEWIIKTKRFEFYENIYNTWRVENNFTHVDGKNES